MFIYCSLIQTKPGLTVCFSPYSQKSVPGDWASTKKSLRTCWWPSDHLLRGQVHSNFQAFLTSSWIAWCLSNWREWSLLYQGMDGKSSFNVNKHLWRRGTSQILNLNIKVSLQLANPYWQGKNNLNVKLLVLFIFWMAPFESIAVPLWVYAILCLQPYLPLHSCSVYISIYCYEDAFNSNVLSEHFIQVAPCIFMLKLHALVTANYKKNKGF